MELTLTPGTPLFMAVREALEQYIENSKDMESEEIDAACVLAQQMDERSQA